MHFQQNNSPLFKLLFCLLNFSVSVLNKQGLWGHQVIFLFRNTATVLAKTPKPAPNFADGCCGRRRRRRIPTSSAWKQGQALPRTEKQREARTGRSLIISKHNYNTNGKITRAHFKQVSHCGLVAARGIKWLHLPRRRVRAR